MSGRWRLPDNGMEWHVIIRQLERVSVDAALLAAAPQSGAASKTGEVIWA
jgi:hypothetical protein